MSWAMSFIVNMPAFELIAFVGFKPLVSLHRHLIGCRVGMGSLGSLAKVAARGFPRRGKVGGDFTDGERDMALLGVCG